MAKPKFDRVHSSSIVHALTSGPRTVPIGRIKPDGLNWLGIFAGLAGMLLLTAGVLLSLHFGTISAGPEAFGSLILLILGDYLLAFFIEGPFVLGIVYMATAVSLVLGKRWAWHLSLTLALLSFGLSMVQVLSSGLFALFGMMTMIISLLIMYYLGRPYVKQFLRISS